jgi:ribonuclease P/MRP protein subunit RPP1
MTRIFTDLHLRVNIQDPKAAQQVIEKAARLGYRAISIPFTGQLVEDQAKALKAACSGAGLDFVLRADYKPRNQEDLTRFLRKFRRKLEVICIICDQKEIARQAAKDHRVDLINFPSLDYHKRFFDRAEAELASCTQTALEVDIKPLLVLEGPARVRLLSSLRREVALAGEFHVPVVVSSGVGEVQFMRMPRDLASLAYLFGLNESDALDAASTNPSAIVTRNREKLNSKFVAPGICVIKEGAAV